MKWNKTKQNNKTNWVDENIKSLHSHWGTLEVHPMLLRQIHSVKLRHLTIYIKSSFPLNSITIINKIIFLKYSPRYKMLGSYKLGKHLPETTKVWKPDSKFLLSESWIISWHLIVTTLHHFGVDLFVNKKPHVTPTKVN